MHQGKYVFSQLMESVVRYQFNQCVARYRGEYRVKHLSCWEQFLALSFGQLSFRESLRDVVVCLCAQHHKLYHLGFRFPVMLPTLAKANEKRDWRIYRDYAQLLIHEARCLYVDDQPFSLDLDSAVYVIDSTTIDLCLSLFPWARIMEKKAALKLHIAMDLRGALPTFFHISKGRTPDLEFLDILEYDRGAYYIMDRGYIDFRRMFAIHQAGAFFVIRARIDLRFRRLYSRRVDRSATGVRCDQVIVFIVWKAKKDYPEKLRRVKYFDAETQRQYVFLTNNFDLNATTIAQLYKYRWQVELFFKWIKQHLSIKAFWGRSANAVKMQICVAIGAYLLVAIMKKRLGIKRNSYEILQILSVSLFDKTPLFKLISEFQLPKFSKNQDYTRKQAQLWDD